MVDTVDKVIIEYQSQNFDQAASDVKTLTGNLDGLTEVSLNTEKSTGSLENKFASLERRFQTTAAQSAQFEKIQSQVNLAVANNPALQERANAVLDAAKSKYIDNGKELGHLDEIGAVLESRMAGLGNSMGLVGQVLQVLGPTGLAAATGLGALALAFNYISEQANKFGESSIAIASVATATGLTTTEVRGLSDAAEKAGISGEQVTSAFERFTANLADARDHTGALYTKLQALDGQLASDIANASSGAAAWDIMAKAINSTSDATTRASIAKAAFGRGGVADVPVLIATDQAGGLAAYSDTVQKATGITDDLTRHTAQLKAEIDATKKQTANVYASMYSDDVLARQAQFAKVYLQIAEAAKSANTIGGPLAPSTDEFGAPFDFTLLNANRAAAAGGGKGALGATSDATGATGAGQDAVKAKAATDALNEATMREINDQKALVSALGNAANSTEKLTLKQLELQQAFQLGKFNTPADPQGTAGLAAAKEQLAIADEAAQAADRQRAATVAIAAAWGDVTQATGLALQSLENQLPVAQALTAADAQQAQYLATITDLWGKGTLLEEATLIAAKKLELSQATATTSVEKQVASLKDQVAMIKAAGNGTEAQTAASIAYQHAIDSGASAESAAALSSETLALYSAQAAAATDQLAASAQKAANAMAIASAAAYQQQLDAQWATDHPTGSQFDANPANTTKTGVTSMSNAGYAVYQQVQQMNADQIKYGKMNNVPLPTDLVNMPNAGFPAAETWGDLGLKAAPSQSAFPAQDLMKTELAKQAAALTSSIQAQTTATNANTSALSPYYTQDPRTSNIGYRSQGMSAPNTTGMILPGMATGGDITVPGGYSANDNMLIPVASGEVVSVRRPGQDVSGGSTTNQTIQITNHITVGPGADKNEIGRTVYQATQNSVRQFQAVSR